MQETSETALLNDAANYIRMNLPEAGQATVLVIAGSGLGGFVKSVEVLQELSYDDIPGVGGVTVAGHAGKLSFAVSGLEKTPILIMSGRRHLYEGLTASEAARLPRAVLMAFPTIKRIVLSNAAGGLDPLLQVGDLMVITDQINWMFKNPLIGRNQDDIGPRFPDASNIYSKELRQLAFKVASNLQIPLKQGVYVAMHGPSYETRSEVAMLRHLLSADAVGMSTVPEAIVAAHAGRQVLGISFISNTLTVPSITSHKEVVENARLVENRFSSLISALVPELHRLQ